MAKIVPIIAICIMATNYAVNIRLMGKFDRLIHPISKKANISWGIGSLGCDVHIRAPIPNWFGGIDQ